ncbi:MAG: TIGR03618 family F420-dependent PPOX class oxidoreductase [Actinobacteria bacterium]|nr:TIGR03618 family F420-dependent PPOX class oxidoreductase [Actinomycetota bacterium]MBU1494879.1 TIGR03618 family F420-dependent PPOX class oxidoreductase [Actinomycetota bacterium]MBU1866575.1 TIGR03618 family F420-dependent PPOX class oxidoreductase [Actinomycetota bacterium]
MTDPVDTKAKLEAFLAEPRLGTLITRRRDGTPVGVPVWFEWTGTSVEMFASRTSAKVRRVRKNPAASLVVANHIGEYEAWVSFEGAVTVSDQGGIELANRLASRYWDLSDPRNRKELDSWERNPEAFCLLKLTPHRIRTG